jgi:hypothetical protein
MRTRVVLFTLMSLACAAAHSASVYRWVDENGVVHYSDQPHENAEKVQVQAPQTYKSQPAPRTAPTAPPAPPASTYQCAIVQPAPDDTFSNAFSVATSVQVTPAPRDGDQAYLLLDGARVPNYPGTGGSYTISNIDRGQHTLQAVVLDGSGKMLCQSANVTFTVMQPSVLNPANPQHKH